MFIIPILVMLVASYIGYRLYQSHLQDSIHPPTKPEIPNVPFDKSVKVQFILKQRETLYVDEKEGDGNYSYGVLHSGLYNSAKFMNDMLLDQGYQSEIIHVFDNSFIDREVTRFRPNIVVIEAFWVVPEKFDVLVKLHPKVKFIIRNHSKTPFLANEGIAFDWIMRYSNTPNVYVSSNSLDTNEEVIELLHSMHGDWSYEDAAARCPFLPNYYPVEFNTKLHEERIKTPGVINIGCFGAIRPLKNQMIQAIAAIAFAERHSLKLRFHINGNRIEGNGNQVLKNLRNLFSHLEHELVENAWMPHDKFMTLVASMDMGMQVSYTETFNIVAADMIAQGVPVVVSKEIDWVDPQFYADPNSCDDIVRVMDHIFECAQTQDSFKMLKSTFDNIHYYDEKTIYHWKTMIEQLK
jgi:hypothetical protein